MGEAKRRKTRLPTNFEVLSPEDGIDVMLHGDRSRLYLSVEEFCDCFNLTKLQFAREAEAKRIIVVGAPGATDLFNLLIPYQSAIEWIARYRLSN